VTAVVVAAVAVGGAAVAGAAVAGAVAVAVAVGGGRFTEWVPVPALFTWAD